MKAINTHYRSPETEILELQGEGILCDSIEGTVETPREDDFEGWPTF